MKTSPILLALILLVQSLFLMGAVITGGVGGGGGTAAQGLGPNFALSGGNIITDSSETKKWTLLGTGPQAVNGGVKYQHSNGEWIETCIRSGVENECDKYVRLNGGKFWGLKDSSNNIDFQYDEITGKISVMTVDARDANINIVLDSEAHFPVATCQNTTASINFDTPTSNAPTAACNTGTNTQKAYLEFDASTDEMFGDHWILPQGFLSVDVHFRWKAAATSGAVGWCAQLIRVADGSTSDPAYPAQATGNCVSDTAKGTTLQENTATIASVTCTSCAAGDHVYVRISRDANGGAVTDDMSGDAFLLMYGRTFWATR